MLGKQKLNYNFVSKQWEQGHIFCLPLPTCGFLLGSLKSLEGGGGVGLRWQDSRPGIDTVDRGLRNAGFASS